MEADVLEEAEVFDALLRLLCGDLVEDESGGDGEFAAHDLVLRAGVAADGDRADVGQAAFLDLEVGAHMAEAVSRGRLCRGEKELDRCVRVTARGVIFADGLCGVCKGFGRGDILFAGAGDRAFGDVGQFRFGEERDAGHVDAVDGVSRAFADFDLQARGFVALADNDGV